MNIFHATSRKLVILGAALGCMATATSAQSLAVTSSTTITYTGDTVPDTTGVDIPTYTFTTSLNNASLDDAGNMFFLGGFADSPLTLDNTNNSAYFYGNKRSNLKMGLRGGTQAPGQPVGYLLRNLLTSSSALSANVRVSPTGSYVWCPSNSWDSVGMTITTQSLFGGPFSPLASQTLIQSQGDPAPGTTETYAQTFSGISLATSGNNANGHVFWQATLSGTTADRFGIWEGTPGSLSLVQRSNTTTNGIPTTNVIAAGTPFGSTVQINSANQVFYEVILSTVSGTTPATAPNDRALIYYTPPSTYNVIVREGDAAPGTVGATFNAITGDAWTPSQSGNNWTRSAKTCFASDLRGGDVSGTTNDRGIWVGGAGSLTLAARKGDAAAGTDGTFSTFGATSLMLNDAGQVCFQAVIAAGTVTTANDTGLWAGSPGSLSLVVREGQVMPGTGGGIAGSVAASESYNDQGCVFFTSTLTGGTNPGTSWWLWHPTMGLMPVLFANDSVEVAPTIFKTLTGAITSFTNNNGDGAAMRFTNNGYIGFKATIAAGSGGGSAMMVIRPPTKGTVFCSGDGTDTACPCNNVGLAGRGCDNTVVSGGAVLTSTGYASVSADTLVLHGAGAIPFGPGLYYEGSTTANPTAPFGVVFGNGLRCAGGATNRLEIVNPADITGGSQTSVALGAFGAAVAGTTYYYQLWYRDGVPGVPTPFFACADTAGFNFSNGLSLAWAP